MSKGMPKPGARLSPSEVLTLRELAQDGAQNSVIAARRRVSGETIKHNLTNICIKSGTQNRTGAALWWIRQGQYLYAEEDHG